MKHTVGLGFELPFIIVGFICLILGLLMLIKPRQSGEVWWRITQATRPWRVAKFPIGWIIATGCLAMLIAVAFLSLSAVFLLRGVR